MKCIDNLSSMRVYLRLLLLIAVGSVLVQAGFAQSGTIADTSWKNINAAALRKCQKACVARILTEVAHLAPAVKPDLIGEYTWSGLRGDGNLELVATFDVNGRGFYNALFIISQSRAGKPGAQEINGWMIRNLNSVIQDLNGDGQKELIIPTVFFQYNTAETFVWPAVYRLEYGKYVEASSYFADFYEMQVLPNLDAKIRASQSASGRGSQATADILKLERDKILRVIGRDPTAGLSDAGDFLKTNDPVLLLAATATFSDIPGHNQDAKEARARYERALCERHPDMAMCKNLPQH